MSARRALADFLTEALPEYQVLPVAKEPDAVTKRTLMLWQDELAPHAPAGRDGVLVTLVVALLSPFEDPTRAEDDLDEALPEVLGTLFPLTWLMWTGATRATFVNDTKHGYRITLTAGGAVTEQED